MDLSGWPGRPCWRAAAAASRMTLEERARPSVQQRRLRTRRLAKPTNGVVHLLCLATINRSIYTRALRLDCFASDTTGGVDGKENDPRLRQERRRDTGGPRSDGEDHLFRRSKRRKGA